MYQIDETVKAIWHHLCNLKNMKNSYEGALLLVKLWVEAINFTKSNSPLYVFVFEIVQMVPNRVKHHR